MGFHKTKQLYSDKETIDREMNQMGKISSNHAPGRGLISRMY